MTSVKIAYKEALKTGTYRAHVEKIEVTEGEYGEQIKWLFRLQPPHGDRELSAWCSSTFSGGSKLFHWWSVLNPNANPKAGFDSDACVGKPCTLSVVQKQSDKGAFNRIDDLLPFDEQEVEQEPLEK